MCHHYRLLAEARELRRQFKLAMVDSQTEFQPGDYYPLSKVPVIRINEESDRELLVMIWGLLPWWWKPSDRRRSHQAFQRKCFNARSETVHEKPSYRLAFNHRRCLIPATSFEEKGHLFSLPDGKPFAFAGLWESWKGEGGEILSCTFVTTTPNAEIQAVGHHRMPILLRTEEEQRLWLDPEIVEREPLEQLLVPAEDGALVEERMG